jgi:hypothetical protein
MHRAAKGYASGGYVAPTPANQSDSVRATAVTVDVRTYVDENGNWHAEVERVSQKQVQKAAPAIVSAANQQVVPTMARYQRDKVGGDYRNG